MALKGQAPAAQVAPKGLFITFEGVDGAGKSTQCGLVCAALERDGAQVMRLREPGGTRLGEGIRHLLLDPAALDEGVAMNPVAELLLYEAARAQLTEQVIQPALAAGTVVVSDRFFDSTVAYQGYARGLGANVTRTLNDLACAGIAPTRTILLDVPAGEALSRAAERSGAPDRLESEGSSFESRVREGFNLIARENPQRVRVVDGTGEVDRVYERVRAALADLVELAPYEQVKQIEQLEGPGADHDSTAVVDHGH